jgi:hypothetical protein
VTTTSLLVQRGGDLYTRSVAVLDTTGTYRYLLRHQWDPSRRVVVWVMLNPSTADAFTPDPTITRCMGFARARAWGFGGICVVNLFAVRSTDPALLATHPDPVGPCNDAFLLGHTTPHRMVIAAWGATPAARERAEHVQQLLTDRGVTLHCLGTNADSSPKHPLYLPKNSAPVTWPGTTTGDQ